ncbi:zinc finger CCCH domain-containing protein 11A [Spea bombifrons]|uniref:zinc finger CCCH domain-containing protein 11A n=1 Tax=Spea bombifrons TaxID=233779 RepID=UPI00234BF70F|nr:zinc finger CCCH domain-containing protein 11A [Spea bombifrons]
MSGQGDDCYFFFYSTCTKGDSCPFRHCEAAIGSETVCTLWQEGRCYRQVCKFRHMAIDKKRSEIPCYWENQMSGCQKANCAFYHYKGRFVDGAFLPPSKTLMPMPEPPEAEPTVSQLQVAQNKISVAPTPQLRGVKKMEANENVPSPTHPPVVINAADDDEDDDDQFSEEGEDLKNSSQQHLSPGNQQGVRGISTKKAATPKKGDSLNFGIKTLEEIKLKKHKVRECAQEHVAASVAQNTGPSDTQVSEMVVPIVRTVTFSKKKDPSNVRLSLSQRLGKRKLSGPDSPLGDRLPPVKKNLSERLGKKVMPAQSGPESLSKKVQFPRFVKDRLGLPAEQNSAETERAANPAAKFHIKTLEEIRQEKANIKKDHPDNPTNVKQSLAPSRSPVHVKTFSEIQAEKRKRQLKEEIQKVDRKTAGDWLEDTSKVGLQEDEAHKSLDVHKTKQKPDVQDKVKQSIRAHKEKAQIIRDENTSNSEEKNQSTKISRVPVSVKEIKETSKAAEEIKVKTLEEIRREKALRLQQGVKSQKEENTVKSTPSIHRRILRISKPADTNLDQRTEPRTTKTQEKEPVMPLPEEQQREKSPAEKVDVEMHPIDHSTTPPVVEMPTGDDLVQSRKPNLKTPKKKIKGKAKVNVEPLMMKNHSPVKSAVKRKAQESLSLASVRPLSTTNGVPVTVEENTNKASIQQIATDASPREESSGSKLSPKQHKESLDLPVPEASCATTPQVVGKIRRASSTSTAKPSLSAEDEFDSLIWEISDGKLEAEIDLDPGKDEDDLLLELSEMIDS